MADHSDHTPRGVPRSVYDPDLGSDGGGRYADPDPVPSIDPDKPVDHVDRLDEPPSIGRWESDPLGHDAYDQATRERGGGRLTDPVTEDVAVCPCCGTVVAADRLRG